MTKRSILLAAIAVPALLLGGCAGTRNRGLESVHQPVVSRTDYIMDVGLVGGTLPTAETQRLSGWMETMHLGYGDHVAIDDPAGIGARAVRQIGAIVAERGLLLSSEAPITAAPVTPGTIRVVVSRMRAEVPGCPDYSRDSSVDYNQNTSSNYGCAINSNVAAMIANPADLVRGQSGSGTTDPKSSFRAIEAFRKAAPSGSGGTVVKSEGVGK